MEARHKKALTFLKGGVESRFFCSVVCLRTLFTPSLLTNSGEYTVQINSCIKAFTLGVFISIGVVPLPAAALAQLDKVAVTGCGGTAISTSYGYTYCAISGSGGSYGGGGGGAGSGYIFEGGGGGVTYRPRLSVGSFHCDYCTLNDPVGTPANPDVRNFITTFVNTMVASWQNSAGELLNVTICNGSCATYQYMAGGTFIRAS